MDPNTGAIVNVQSEENALAQGLIPIKRKLTDRELFTTQIELYSPCICGSGQKAKFCCRKPPEYVYRPNVTLADIRLMYQPPVDEKSSDGITVLEPSIKFEETANVG